MPRRIYLVDHESFKPPEEYRLLLEDVRAAWCTQIRNSPLFKGAQTPEELQAAEARVLETHDFLERVFKRSGLSLTGTFLPHSVHPKHGQPQTDMNSAMAEAKEAMVGAVQGLLHKTGISPQDVDILVTTCSIFCPTPSLSAMLVNHFKMRPDIQAYHLGGMGCSNGVVAINLLRDMLNANPNKNAVFVTHETVTPAIYTGTDRSRLVTNVLFRMGASAALLSNKRSWLPVAKYELKKCVRVHQGRDDESYRCIWYGPDEAGVNGVALKMSVVTEASKALTAALTRVAPSVMTWAQVGRYLLTEGQRKLAELVGGSAPEAYKPAFSEGVQHFLLHAGGAKVLDSLGKALQLSEDHLEASRAVLYDYGNVSSSTTWYALGYVESVQGVKAGSKVLQVGMGSGMKCGVNVWKALRDVDSLHGTWDSRVSQERRAALSSGKQVHCCSKQSTLNWPDEVQRLLVLVLLLAVAVLSMLPRAMLPGYLTNLI